MDAERRRRRSDAQGRFSGLLGAPHLVDDAPAADPTGTAAEFVRVLADGAVRTAFQPIVSLADGRVVGVDALSRFAGIVNGRTADDWFTDAAQVGLGFDLEIHAACRRWPLPRLCPRTHACP